MDEQETAVDDDQWPAPQPAENHVSIGRLQDGRDRVAPALFRVPGGDRQQVKVVVAQHGDRGGAERHHLAQHVERSGAAVDEIADEPEPVLAGGETDELEEPAEFGVAALDVADCVVTHGAMGERPLERAATSGGACAPMLESASILTSACAPSRFVPMSFPLNPAQREAVRYLDGPLLVLAGAGSGKTRVIAAKIGHLVERGHDPKRIVAITFTNRAAREMRERAGELLARQGSGDLAAAVTICTFHALGLKVIRSHAAALGLKPGFSILDPGDIEGIVAELTGTTDRARARAAQWRISAWKNALVAPAAAAKAARSDDDRAAAQAYRRYDDTLRAYQAVDFDDLIALPIGLLATDEAAAAQWRERCGYLLVDEYQDTNPAQYRLSSCSSGNARRSPSSATTTRRSTAGAAPRSTIWRSCRRTSRR